MVITVKFFASLRELANADECRLTLSPGACALEARRLLEDRYPGLGPLLSCARPALNLEYRSWDALVQDGDELALIPPVSGG
jgi:molybdopterin converting factor small subunit